MPPPLPRAAPIGKALHQRSFYASDRLSASYRFRDGDRLHRREVWTAVRGERAPKSGRMDHGIEAPRG